MNEISPSNKFQEKKKKKDLNDGDKIHKWRHLHKFSLDIIRGYQADQ